MALHEVLSALADETRRKILLKLKKGRISSGDLALALNMTPQALSYHLSKLKKADLIYVGGGDTRSMLEVWRRHGVDELILKAYEKGTVITGISAGLIFWFRYGHSDSEFFKNPESWDYIFVEGLNKFPIACCPHYNEEGRDSFDSMLKHKNCAGIALENDTAFVVDGEQISIKKARNDAKAYLFEPENGQLIKRELVEGERIDLELFRK